MQPTNRPDPEPRSGESGAEHPDEPSLEPAPCPRCRRPPTELVRRAGSWLDDVRGLYEVRACSSCGLWTTSPRPVQADLPLVYPGGYHRSRVDDLLFPPRPPEQGTLLDVGCGVGDSLVQARSEGWRCVGIDASEEAAAIARSRGFEVIVGDAATVEYPAERFDVVRCWHALEHVPDPVRLLERLRDAVAPSGIVELLLPNRRSVTCLLFRRYWYHLDLPRHLHHFRPQDVRALAEHAGLRVISVRQTASPSGLLGSLDCLAAGLAGRQRAKLRTSPRLRATARLATWSFARLGLADVVAYRLVHENAPRGSAD